jgi:NRPS condensation-like uncharacterized protein
MNATNGRMMGCELDGLLQSLRRKGVKLTLQNGQLRYEGPKGALTPSDIAQLRAAKLQVVAILERSRSPVAFSQLVPWHLCQLRDRPSSRSVAQAIRLCGRLKTEALIDSVAEVVRRHGSLRTRIVVVEGLPAQEISAANHSELQSTDLTGLPQDQREPAIQRYIEQLIIEPIDVAKDPLFAVRLLKVRDDEHVFIAALDHIICDGLSMRLLLREIFSAYVQSVCGRAVCQPDLPPQFSDYARRLHDTHDIWLQKHGSYWSERLAGCQRVRFPEDHHLPAETHGGWATVPFKIDQDQQQELAEWCRSHRTTAPIALFTAYVGLVLRWCGVADAVILLMTTGRVTADLERVIGNLASILYLRVEFSADQSFARLLNHVTREFCNAHEHADSSRLAAQMPRSAFAQNPSFNWVPPELGIDLSELDGSDDALTNSPIPFADPVLETIKLDNEPGVVLMETDSGIAGGVYFPKNRFSPTSMERFGTNFLNFLKRLMRDPEQLVQEVAIL